MLHGGDPVVHGVVEGGEWTHAVAEHDVVEPGELEPDAQLRLGLAAKSFELEPADHVTGGLAGHGVVADPCTAPSRPRDVPRTNPSPRRNSRPPARPTPGAGRVPGRSPAGDDALVPTRGTWSVRD